MHQEGKKQKHGSSIVCLSWEHLPFSDGRSDFSKSCRKEGLEEKIVIDSAGTGDWHVSIRHIKEHKNFKRKCSHF